MVMKKGKSLRIRGLTLSYTSACTWMFVTYMASGFLRTLLSIILSKLRMGSTHVLFANLIIYTPFFILLLYSLCCKKIFFGIKQFCFVFITMALLFFITWLLNPSYEVYLTRSVFGAADSVFRPDFGAIWGFLIVAVSVDSKRLYYNLYLGAWGLAVYCIYQYAGFLGSGYWNVYNYLGELDKQTYSLDFSYSCCFCASIFLVMYSKKHCMKDLLMFIISVSLMILGGARGSIACLAVFMGLYYLKTFLQLSHKKKFIVIVGLAASVFFLYILMPVIINRLSQINSRSIQSILTGSFTEDNGRLQIYAIVEAAMEKMPFWGYGPFGDRPFIAPHYYWGYAHNIVYEIIMDFGWVIGIAILAVFGVRCVQVYIQAKEFDLAVISILLGANAKLFLSASFWAYAQFWMLLAYLFVIVPIRKRRDKREKTIMEVPYDRSYYRTYDVHNRFI